MGKNLDAKTICHETTLCLTISATPARADIHPERPIYSRIPTVCETVQKLPHKAINALEKAYTSARAQGAKKIIIKKHTTMKREAQATQKSPLKK